MQKLKNLWNDYVKYFLTGCLLGVVIDTFLFAAIHISESPRISKFVDVAAVFIGLFLILLRDKVKKKLG